MFGTYFCFVMYVYKIFSVLLVLQPSSGGRQASCFTLIVLFMFCACLSFCCFRLVCDCDIYWSYSLSFFVIPEA